jgi:TM2 domain-containing membrane protein YozV
MPCPFCEAALGLQAKKCRHCGEWVSRTCEQCGTPVRGEWAARGVCAECRTLQNLPAAPAIPLAMTKRKRKSRSIAAMTAFFFGGLGLHRFYLGNYLAGFVYLAFCWTLIPSLVGMFQGIRYALMDDLEFQQRYGPVAFDR